MDRNYQRTKGIVCIVLSAFCFATMNLFIRLSGELPTWQKGFFRNAVALIVASFILFRERKKPGMKITKKNILLLILRATAGTIGFLANFYCVDRMNISDASMLNKLAPFFTIIFSAIFIKESAKWYQWLAVLVAFLGSLLIVKPTFSMEMFPALCGVIGGLGAGIAYTCVRKLGQMGVGGALIVFFFSAFSVVVLGPVVVFTYVPMSAVQWGFLLLTGLAASGGQFFVTAAYTYAPAKEISVYDYFQVIFAALWGMIFLSQKPDLFSVAGYLIIVAAAVAMYIIQKKQKIVVG
ncbi:MAG: DMT family transporter [Lachnospiraceae bacterium]|nr:DMT family transporter [Lachnospiraceae bacterium]